MDAGRGHEDRIASLIIAGMNDILQIRRQKAEIQSLSRRMNLLSEKLEDLSDMVRPVAPAGGGGDGFNGAQD